MTLTEYREAMNAVPIGTYPAELWSLLVAVEAAWANAEGGIPSENEARRWSPVCNEAARIVAKAAGA